MSTSISIPSYHDDLQKLIQQLEEMLPAEEFAVFNRDAQTLADRYTDPLQIKLDAAAPDFILPNATGQSIQLSKYWARGPVVLTFYRGAWCPYCNLQLRQLQESLPEFQAKGAQLLAVSPMTPDQSLSLQEKSELGFEVLSDVGNQVARKYTTVFRNDEAPIAAMTKLGYDFFGFYGDDSAELPVPATFIINQQGLVRFAFSGGGDYRKRVEPSDLFAVLNQE